MASTSLPSPTAANSARHAAATASAPTNATLPLLTPRCRCHAATALPNALPLLPKLHFRQAATSAAKLATATTLLPLPPLLLPLC
jgi:hypothetical protein